MCSVDVVVIYVFEEFEMVKVDDLVGFGEIYSFGKCVDGVDWCDLKIG